MSGFKEFNEKHYNIAYIVITAIVIALAVFFGFGAMDVLGGILLKSVTYTVSSVLFLKACMGKEVDVYTEITKEHNTALAILLAGFMAGLGFAIGGI